MDHGRSREGWEASFTPFMPHGWTGIFAAMGLTFIAFEGYEIIAQTSEEVENPKRNVPRAVFLSLFIVVPIYLLVAFVAIGAVTPPPGMTVTQYLGEQKEIALVKAAEQFVTGGALVILVGGLLSTLSALNATIYSSSRVAFAMARDASLPQVVARVHRERATPHFAILFSALLIIVMAVALPIEDVAAAASVMFLLLFGGVNVALIRLRRLHPELDRGFKVPFVPFTPILAIVAMLFLAGFMLVDYPLAGLAAGGWIAAGCAFYYAYSRKRETAFGERVTWMERIERREYGVLVAISSPRTMESLLESAMAIARQHDGELVVVTVAEVPEGETLFSGRRQVRELEPVLERAVRYAEERGVAVRPVIKIARRIGHGLAQTAREEGCNFLVIGQPSTPVVLRAARGLDRGAGPAGRALSRGGGLRRDRQGQGHPHRGPGDPGRQLEAGGGARHSLQPVVRGAHPRAHGRRARGSGKRRAGAGGRGPGDPAGRRERGASSRFCCGPRSNTGLLRNLKRGELVLIGAPSSGPVVPLFGETIPALIAKRGRNPVVVVRHVEELRARRFERLFFARS